MTIVTLPTDRKVESLAASAVGGFDSPIRGAEFKAAMQSVATRIINYGCRLVFGEKAKADVKVTFAGKRAFCRHRRTWSGVHATINLPSLDDGRVLTRAEANRWLGYLIHECFHVVMTERTQWDAFCMSRSPFRGRMLNAVEDARIERDGVALGVAHGFAKVGSLLLAHLMAEGDGKYDANDPRQMPWVFAVGLRSYAVPGTDTLIAALRPEIRDVLAWARQELAAIPQPGPTAREGTALAGALADKIADKLKAIFAEPDVEQPDEEGDDGQQGEPGEPGEPGKGKRGKGKPESEEQDEQDEGEGAGEPSDVLDEDEDDGEGAGAGESDDGDDEGESAPGPLDEDEDDGEGLGLSGDDGDDGDDGEGEGADGEGDDGDDESDDAGEGDGAEGDAGEISDETSDLDSTEGSNGGDVSQTRGGKGNSDPIDIDKLADSDITKVEPSLESDHDFDPSAPVENYGKCGEINVDSYDWVDAPKNAKSAERALRGVRGLVGARGALRRLLQRTDSSGDVRGMKGGRLVPSRIHRAALGDDAIFSRRWEEEGVDVAVSIVIDTSSSMKTGRKINAAALTALVLAEQLVTTPGCKVEVLGFTTDGETNDGFDDYRDWLEAGLSGHNGYAHGCNFRVYKRFTEHIGFLRRRWAQVQYQSGGTPDMAALHGVAARLGKQQAGRRICFFICDGEGSHVSQFRPTVERLSKKHGILFIGLGIGCGWDFRDRFQFGAVVWDVNRLAEDALNLIVKAVEKSGKVR